MKRVLVYGDSNSWGYPADGSGVRMKDNWPAVMERHLEQVEVIHENFPGRTTVHDDFEHLGEANNGLRFLEVALRSHAPVDALVFLLGTNDLKARFQPNAEKIAANLGRLIAEVRRVGGASRIWEDTTPPKIFVISPPPLSDRAIDPNWERVDEWAGAKPASAGLAASIAVMCKDEGAEFFDSAHFVEGGQDDPIHWTESSHLKLGQAVAHWLTRHGL